MIVVFSPNTAQELIVGVPRLAPGAVHRATRAIERIGGKGVNVARFCGLMGVGVRLVAVTDDAGQRALMEDPDLALATIEVVPSGVRARTDVIVVEPTGRATVLNGTAEGPVATVIGSAVEQITEGLGPEDLLVLTGSLPAGASADVYPRLIKEARARGAMTLLDASGAWLRAALPAGPDVLKVSAQELADAREVSPAEAWRDGRIVAPEPGSVIVTAGPRGARLWSDDTRWTVAAPRVAPVNPIGAGDALMAGLCAGMAAGSSLPEALAQGVAWAAAKVQDFDLSFDPGVARALRPGVRVVRRTSRPAAS